MDKRRLIIESSTTAKGDIRWWWSLLKVETTSYREHGKDGYWTKEFFAHHDAERYAKEHGIELEPTIPAEEKEPKP